SNVLSRDQLEDASRISEQIPEQPVAVGIHALVVVARAPRLVLGVTPGAIVSLLRQSMLAGRETCRDGDIELRRDGGVEIASERQLIQSVGPAHVHRQGQTLVL